MKSSPSSKSNCREETSDRLHKTENPFLEFLESIRHNLISFNLLECRQNTNHHFKYKVLQEKISLGVINRISCDACNLSFQAKSFEIQNHCLFFIYIFRGDCEIAEGNQSPEDIREGEFVFYEALQKITIKSDKRVDFILALLSEPYVLTHTKHDPELYCGRIFKSKSAANKLFSSVLATTFKSLPFLPLDTHELVLDGLFSYLRPSFKELEVNTALTTQTHLDFLWYKGNEVIRRRFKDPSLQLSDIAAELSVSKRYLSQAFRQRGTTVHKQLMGFRLKRASVMLSEEHCRHFSVEEIAKRNGFKQISHFSRLFKEEFGITPSEKRNKSIFY